MNLLKSFSTYTLASFIERGIAFFLLPVFTFYLTPKDYGTLSLLQSIFGFLAPLISLGSLGAISVAYYNEGRENYPSYFTSCLVMPGAITLVLTVLLLIGQNFIGNYFEIPSIWIIVIPMFCFLSVFNSMLLIDYQIKNEPFNYAKFSLSNSTIGVLLSLFFVIILGFNYSGRLFGQYSGLIVFALIAFFILHNRKVLVKTVKLDYIKDSLKFGLPLVPHTLGCMVIEISDRLFIDKILGKEILGIYNTGYIIGSTVAMLCAAFANAIIPFSYNLFKIDTLEAKKKLVKVYWIFVLILATVLFFLWLLAPYIFKYFIDSKFNNGQIYVFWVGLGYFFQGLYLLFANIIFYFKKTKILFYWSFVNVAVNLTLNYIFIHKLGAIGAAYATCISYFLFFIAMAIITNRYYSLPWFSFLKK
ncbi:oligosaccharide flippase family protein [Pedobacter sp. UC225_61]|uniref:oligosaccharide flippase family protein n=1 Tax=Pedobacter sp. UC225_61 TaxID=3374623 RepID=UPI0037B2CDE2